MGVEVTYLFGKREDAYLNSPLYRQQSFIESQFYQQRSTILISLPRSKKVVCKNVKNYGKLYNFCNNFLTNSKRYSNKAI